MERTPSVAILMPAFNEGDRLSSTLAELAAATSRATFSVFVVDDGSTTPVDPDAIAEAAPGLRFVFARHVVNLGQGASLETARRLALSAGEDFDAYVTMDADGQHAVDDVLSLVSAIADGANVALGNRFAGGSRVPRSRRALLGLARVFERLVTGLELSDAHNGLRAFDRRALASITITRNRMAHATEITRRISKTDALRIVEVPVSIRYTDASLAKGQSATGAVTIVVDLFQGFLFGK